ncbi:hypothetical protein [Methanosarcina sp. MSH10X1]|nr:hypothetical protein [Methanosarcina sp. MSH10X1]
MATALSVNWFGCSIAAKSPPYSIGANSLTAAKNLLQIPLAGGDALQEIE